MQGYVEDLNTMIYLKTSLPEEDFYKHKNGNQNMVYD